MSVTIEDVLPQAKNLVQEYRAASIASMDKTDNEFVRSQNLGLCALEMPFPELSSVCAAKSLASREGHYGHMIEGLASLVAYKNPRFTGVTSATCAGIDMVLHDVPSNNLTLWMTKAGPKWANHNQWEALPDAFKEARAQLGKTNHTWMQQTPSLKPSPVTGVVFQTYGPNPVRRRIELTKSQKAAWDKKSPGKSKPTFIVITGQQGWFWLSGGSDHIFEDIVEQAFVPGHEDFRRNILQKLNMTVPPQRATLKAAWSEALQINSGNMNLLLTKKKTALEQRTLLGSLVGTDLVNEYVDARTGSIHGIL